MLKTVPGWEWGLDIILTFTMSNAQRRLPSPPSPILTHLNRRCLPKVSHPPTHSPYSPLLQPISCSTNFTFLSKDDAVLPFLINFTGTKTSVDGKWWAGGDGKALGGLFSPHLWTRELRIVAGGVTRARLPYVHTESPHFTSSIGSVTLGKMMYNETDLPTRLMISTGVKFPRGSLTNVMMKQCWMRRPAVY